MKMVRRAYSLLLLMVLIISGMSAFSLCLIHCHTHLDHSGHHHCESRTFDCEGHDSSVKEGCAAEFSSSAHEYITVRGEVELRISSLTLWADLLSVIDFRHNLSVVFELDRWREHDIYQGFLPSLGLLRAPPVLV